MPELEHGGQDMRRFMTNYSYPCLIQTADGMLHITFLSRTGETEKSIKHWAIIKFDVAKSPDKFLFLPNNSHEIRLFKIRMN